LHDISNPKNLVHMIELVLLALIPLIIIIGLFLHAKNRLASDCKQKELDIEMMREELLRIAREKKAQRDAPIPEPEKSPEIDRKAIEEQIKAERGEYYEFELLSPIKELQDDEDAQNRKNEN